MADAAVAALRTSLDRLLRHPSPFLPTPVSNPRRASVALVVRVRPSPLQWPDVSSPPPAPPATLDAFFAQDWVRHGEPEVLFIKRASRKGDRWTAHIALPGGKRDPEDADDRAAAVREAWEEVGLDLNPPHAFDCGNLPQRIVTTHWGKKPLLVLCPYVFLLTGPSVVPLHLQPDEVASSHWVPIRSLQDPARRTVVFEDVSSRIANQETGVTTWMLRLILGQMMFAAIALLPTETLHSTSSAPISAADDSLQDNRHARPTRWSRARALAARIYHSDIFLQYPAPPPEGPLLLWGLTLGVISDFLDLVPPHDGTELWTYPNFTPLDVRFAVWLLTYRFQARKRVELQAGTVPLSTPSFASESESVAPVPSPAYDEAGFHGLGTGVAPPALASPAYKAAVAGMLRGWVDRVLAPLLLPEVADRARYYDLVRRAVVIALLARAGLVGAVVVWAWRRKRGRVRWEDWLRKGWRW